MNVSPQVNNTIEFLFQSLPEPYGYGLIWRQEPSDELTKINICGAEIDIALIKSHQTYIQNRPGLNTYRQKYKFSKDLFNIHPDERVDYINEWELAYRQALIVVSRRALLTEVSCALNEDTNDSITEMQEALHIVSGSDNFAMDALHFVNVQHARKKGIASKIIRRNVANKFKPEKKLLTIMDRHAKDETTNFANELMETNRSL